MVSKIIHDWKQAERMSPWQRKAIIYTHHDLEGANINWSTGEINYPKPEGT